MGFGCNLIDLKTGIGNHPRGLKETNYLQKGRVLLILSSKKLDFTLEVLFLDKDGL